MTDLRGFLSWFTCCKRHLHILNHATWQSRANLAKAKRDHVQRLLVTEPTFDSHRYRQWSQWQQQWTFASLMVKLTCAIPIAGLHLTEFVQETNTRDPVECTQSICKLDALKTIIDISNDDKLTREYNLAMLARARDWVRDRTGWNLVLVEDKCRIRYPWSVDRRYKADAMVAVTLSRRDEDI